jgi:acyl-CoA synthetase (NDP forming)
MDVQMKESLQAIFKPGSVAVVGASNNIMSWGFGALNSLFISRYRHTIYPINPNEKTIQGIRSFPSLMEVPGEIDLAVIVVNAASVPRVIEECIAKKVKGGIVITAGFAEISSEGALLQKKIAEKSKKAGFYFLGPNCLGVWSIEGRLNTFPNLARRPHRGSIAFVSQSGTLSNYLFAASRKFGFGVSKVISFGNQASITYVDLLEYLGDDPTTQVIISYVEDIGDGHRFLNVARSVTGKKPLLIYKAGTSEAAARAARSHTAALAGNDEIFDAVCRQAGAIRWFDFMEMFYMANSLCYQPLPKGNRVAILHGGGGFCVTAAEACTRLGLNVPEMNAQAQKELREQMLPFSPPPVNPIDCIGRKNEEAYIRIIEIAAKQDNIDGLIVMPPRDNFDRYTNSSEMIETLKYAEAIATIPKRFKKPIVVAGNEGRISGPIDEIFKRYHIPTFENPVDCAQALLGMVKYHAIKDSKNRGSTD